VDAHLLGCARCRGELEEIRAGAESLKALSLAMAPDGLWRAIEAGMDQPEPRRAPMLQWRLAAGLAGVAALLLAVWWSIERPTGEHWDVMPLAGAPILDSTRIDSTAKIAGGGSIETDGASRARIQVGAIGTVDVEPNSQVTVITADPREHRLALRSGEIVAKISAPPRLFFVETASVTAVDLGCEYTLQCDRSGSGMLRVQAGWVLLERDGRESLVPAGASCATRPDEGPGSPYFEDASPSFIEALETFDFGGGGENALTVILTAARTRDTLTLWHLLSRVSAEDRVRVYERMAVLAPPPAGVSREKALDLNPETLTRWREELAWIW
jgi:hypothetical protein